MKLISCLFVLCLGSAFADEPGAGPPPTPAGPPATPARQPLPAGAGIGNEYHFEFGYKDPRAELLHTTEGIIPPFKETDVGLIIPQDKIVTRVEVKVKALTKPTVEYNKVISIKYSTLQPSLSSYEIKAEGVYRLYSTNTN